MGAVDGAKVKGFAAVSERRLAKLEGVRKVRWLVTG